jgi:Fe-S-cluster containining protein
MLLLGSIRSQVDFSELIGRRFECLDRCQLCCLCQPEVLPGEISFFSTTFPNNLILENGPRKYAAISLKKGRGSCSFLDHRRCVVYEHRPHFCRTFPFRFYVGNVIQVELNLSCRGVWTGRGRDASAIASSMVDDNAEALMTTLSDSRRIYAEFIQNCTESGIHTSVEILRSQVNLRMRQFSDLHFLARVLEMSTQEEKFDLARIEIDDGEKIDMDDLEIAARETAMDSLSSVDPIAVPVYCDGAGQWNILESKNGKIEWSILDEEGDTHHEGTIDPEDVRLVSPEEGGRDMLIDYLRILNNRDSMIGYAYFLADDYGYEDQVSNVYYGAFATTVLNLLWRVSLLNTIHGGRPNREGIREGIIFYDMDQLDAPTLGAFV